MKLLAPILFALSALALAMPAAAQSPPPPQTDTPSEATPGAKRERKPRADKPAREPSAAQLAVRERQQKCSAEWKDARAAGKVAPGQKWPQFWSACNARLKGKVV
ncbi:MAG TPA: hypothetical protein VIL09_15860 [Microvirga sp.]|jgi:hypothetical protein